MDTTEQLPDLCMNLLLALNLHLTGGVGPIWRGQTKWGVAGFGTYTLTWSPFTSFLSS